MRIAILSLILASVMLSATAQMFLKIGVGRVGASATGPAGSALVSMLTSPMVIVGLGLYGFGALLWLFVLSRVPLSLAYPFVGAGFIVTAVIGIAVLGEQFSWARATGTLMIAAGCVIVAQSA